MFIELLTTIVTTSNNTKNVSLSNQKCMTYPTFINLHPNEYNQKLHYHPFAVKLDGCFGRLLMTYLIKYLFQTKQKI